MFRNEGWPHYNDMVDLIPMVNRHWRLRPEQSNNGNDDVDLNGVEADPEKSASSEASRESSLDSEESELYVVLAEAAGLAALCAAQFLMRKCFPYIQPPQPDSEPCTRIGLAVKHVQGDGLDRDQLLTLIKIFQADSSSVDAYLNLLDFEDLRKAWLQMKLGHSA